MEPFLIPISFGLGMCVTGLYQIFTCTLHRRRRYKAFAERRAHRTAAWDAWCAASIKSIRDGSPIPPWKEPLT